MAFQCLDCTLKTTGLCALGSEFQGGIQAFVQNDDRFNLTCAKVYALKRNQVSTRTCLQQKEQQGQLCA